jgi:SOS-response transcriptional repressor LexA
MPRKESSFLLPVGSTDMQEAGILPGDTLIVEKGFPAHPNDVVVVDLHGSWKLRRLNRQDKNLSSPEKEDCRLVGVVTAVIRKYH